MEELRADPVLVTMAVQQTGQAFKFASRKHSRYSELELAAKSHVAVAGYPGPTLTVRDIVLQEDGALELCAYTMGGDAKS